MSTAPDTVQPPAHLRGQALKSWQGNQAKRELEARRDAQIRALGRLELARVLGQQPAASDVELVGEFTGMDVSSYLRAVEERRVVRTQTTVQLDQAPSRTHQRTVRSFRASGPVPFLTGVPPTKDGSHDATQKSSGDVPWSYPSMAELVAFKATGDRELLPEPSPSERVPSPGRAPRTAKELLT